MPYHIDPDKSDLDGGDYDPTTNTITWIDKISDNSDAKLDIKHSIKLVFTDIDYTQDTMKNEITAKLSLYDLDIKDEASDEIISKIDANGTITIKYIDEYSKQSIADDVVISDRIGKKVDISKYIKEFQDYQLPSINPRMEIKAENQEVSIMYKHNAVVTIKFIDVNGLEILDIIKKMGMLGEKITIDENTKLDGYTLVKAPASNLVLIDSNEMEIVYYFAKNTSIKVRYVDIDQNRDIINAITIDGYDGKDYTTDRKEFVGYTFKEVRGTTAGKMNLNENEVTYYYTKYVPQVQIVTITDPADRNTSSTNNSSTYTVRTYENTPSKATDNSSYRPANNAGTPSTNNNVVRDNNNQVISVANTGKNANPMFVIIGGILVVLGSIVIVTYRKKTRKVFYV